MSTESKMIDSLWTQVTTLGGAEGHAKLTFEDKSKVAVISVYRNQRASHEVLDDLYEWAEENKDQILMDKITQLSEVE